MNTNYNYEELTAFDKYLLNKRNGDVKTPDFKVAQPKNVENCSEKLSYDEYLINELRRKVPSDKKVMSKDEYEATMYGVVGRADAVTAVKNKFQFRKYGKILLCIYVIFVLALAFIVIGGSTNSIASDESAGAAAVVSAPSKSNTIDAMTIAEEETEETNWFDKLCDSLNK